jgi:hypothetical protein
MNVFPAISGDPGVRTRFIEVGSKTVGGLGISEKQVRILHYDNVREPFLGAWDCGRLQVRIREFGFKFSCFLDDRIQISLKYLAFSSSNQG